MKLSALERILFVTGFVLTAGICLGFLFGYRYSFDLQRVEQRGVVVLSGSMDQVTVKFLDQEKVVSLPYVDTSVPFGKHHMEVSKIGHVPVALDVDVRKDEAAIVPLELAPQLLTGQQRTFDTTTRAQYFRGMGVVQHKSASGVLLTHAEHENPVSIYLPASLRRGSMKDIAVTHVSDTQLLLSFERIFVLYDETQTGWTQIRLGDKEVIKIDQGMLLAYTPTEGSLRYINSETGRVEPKPFLEDIQEIQQSRVTDVATGTAYNLYITKDNSVLRLRPRWFTIPAVETLGRTDSVHLKNLTLVLTREGALVRKGVEVLTGIQKVFDATDVVLATTNDHAVYSLAEDGTPKFLTRFSSAILHITPQKKGQYVYVQTRNALYFCERRTLSRCTELATSMEESDQRGVDAEGNYLWYTDKDKRLHLVPFFQEL